MDLVHVIRHKVLVEEVPIRAVARDLGVSRNTVRKYLRESEPARKCVISRGKPVMEAVEGRIDELLAEWSTRTTAKQRVTGTRVHRELLAEGYCAIRRNEDDAPTSTEVVAGGEARPGLAGLYYAGSG